MMAGGYEHDDHRCEEDHPKPVVERHQREGEHGQYEHDDDQARRVVHPQQDPGADDRSQHRPTGSQDGPLQGHRRVRPQHHSDGDQHPVALGQMHGHHQGQPGRVIDFGGQPLAP
jgi:hypothetical protein